MTRIWVLRKDGEELSRDTGVWGALVLVTRKQMPDKDWNQMLTRIDNRDGPFTHGPYTLALEAHPAPTREGEG